MHSAPRSSTIALVDRARPTNIELRTPAQRANAIPDLNRNTPGTKLDRQDGGPKMTNANERMQVLLVLCSVLEKGEICSLEKYWKLT